MGPQSTEVNACTQAFLANKLGPGGQKLVAHFSLYNFSQNFWTSVPSFSAKWGLYGLGRALGVESLKVLGGAIALGAGGATGAATIMDAEARHACGESVVP